jgi:membrane-associated phospholipid phosphatase
MQFSRLKYTVIAIVICAVLVALSIAYVDRPVARFAYAHKQYWPTFKILALPSLLSLPFSCIYLAGYAVRVAFGWQRGLRSNLLLMISVATAITTSVKDELKWVIGRPWPIEWIRRGVYNCHPFTQTAYFGSFPSGHTAYIAAPMFVLWWRLPQYRAVWIAIVFVVMIGLVGSGYHFVADVISGFFLGLAAATGTVAVWPDAIASGDRQR